MLSIGLQESESCTCVNLQLTFFYYIRHSALFNGIDLQQQIGAFVEKIALNVTIDFCVIVIYVSMQ